jgi:TolA-binding protein
VLNTLSGSAGGAGAMQKAPLPSKKPRVFAVDLKSPAGGEESALFQIVKEYFEKRDWENSRIALLHYLSLPRSAEVEARARFYLGQAWYFTGNYREALFEFLSVQNLHPVEANIWIDAILTAMVY